MKVAITGGTGFIGRYMLQTLASEGYELKAWRRESSDLSGLEELQGKLNWQLGSLGNSEDSQKLVAGCDAVVHAAFDRPGRGFQNVEGDLIEFVQTNVVGSLKLIEAAREAGVRRFIFISSCAVHDKILDDRSLDEKHPTWAATHYGAYKAAVEQFVYSFGYGHDYEICSLRPTGVYGVNHPIEHSKWFKLVESVAKGESVECNRGGKEVHVADVAKAVSLLLRAEADKIKGQAFNCYDRYVSQYEVATLAQKISGSNAKISGAETTPKNQIDNSKLKSLGMEFGGRTLLEETIDQLVKAIN